MTPEKIIKQREELTANAKEAPEHLYQATLKTPEFTLKNGTKCKVKPYYEPQENDDGEVKCGADLVLEDGAHVGITVTATAWEKSFVADIAETTQNWNTGQLIDR
jgi:hypothetical protein